MRFVFWGVKLYWEFSSGLYKWPRYYVLEVAFLLEWSKKLIPCFRFPIPCVFGRRGRLLPTRKRRRIGNRKSFAMLTMDLWFHGKQLLISFLFMSWPMSNCNQGTLIFHYIHPSSCFYFKSCVNVSLSFENWLKTSQTKFPRKPRITRCSRQKKKDSIFSTDFPSCKSFKRFKRFTTPSVISVLSLVWSVTTSSILNFLMRLDSRGVRNLPKPSSAKQREKWSTYWKRLRRNTSSRGRRSFAATCWPWPICMSPRSSFNWSG